MGSDDDTGYWSMKMMIRKSLLHYFCLNVHRYVLNLSPANNVAVVGSYVGLWGDTGVVGYTDGDYNNNSIFAQNI